MLRKLIKPQKPPQKRHNQPRKCEHPYCDEVFTGRPNKKYCHSSCRKHAAYLRKLEENATTYQLDEIRHNNEDILGLLHEVDTFREEGLSEKLLRNFHVVPECYSHPEVNRRTNKVILWCYHYGLELLAGTKDHYMIHFREEVPQFKTLNNEKSANPIFKHAGA